MTLSEEFLLAVSTVCSWFIYIYKTSFGKHELEPIKSKIFLELELNNDF